MYIYKLELIILQLTKTDNSRFEALYNYILISFVSCFKLCLCSDDFSVLVNSAIRPIEILKLKKKTY